MREKFEIKNINDLLNVFENTDGYYLGDYTCFQIADYIRKMYNQLQQKENIIKEAINCIKEESWFCYKDNEEIIDRTPANKLLEILEDNNEQR